jgi:hypothetical protein
MTNKDKDAEAQDTPRRNSTLAKTAQDVILPQLVDAFRKEGAPVDINVLLVQVIQKTHDPGDAVEKSRQIMAMVKDIEQQRVENFSNMAQAVIDVKLKDPDEIEKRRNNRMRRILKGLVGVCALGGLGGGIAGAAMGASLIVTSLLVAAGALALSMSGPLAAGESVSSSDVVRILNSLRWMKPSDEDDEDEEEQERRPPAKRRRKR